MRWILFWLNIGCILWNSYLLGYNIFILPLNIGAAFLLFEKENFLKWFNKDWWEYLLEKPSQYSNNWKSFWCRKKGHEEPIFYNPTGSEPDMRCKNCYDHIG